MRTEKLSRPAPVPFDPWEGRREGYEISRCRERLQALEAEGPVDEIVVPYFFVLQQTIWLEDLLKQP